MAEKLNTNMADNEKELIRIAEDLYQKKQIDQAKEALLNGLEEYPDNIVMKDLFQQYQDKLVDLKTQEVNKEKKENATDLDRKTNINIVQYIDEIEQKNLNDINIANNSFQMRLKALGMEINIIKTYCDKELIEKDNNTIEKIRKIEVSGNTIFIINNFEEAEDELLVAENLSSELMKKVNKVVNKKNATKKEVEKPKNHIEVPDYRSIVTVKGTKEDVMNCILKAEKALKNGKYDRAESLLLKAERMLPTKNARNLLKEVQAKKAKQISDHKKATEAIEQVKEEKSKSEGTKLNKEEIFDKDAVNNKTTASQPSSDEAIATKIVKNDNDLKLDIKTELLINLAIDAMSISEFGKARWYLKLALEKQPNENVSTFVKELLRIIQIDNRNERIPLSRNNMQLEANRLLDKTENLISSNDLEKAESVLNVSWKMDKNTRAIMVQKNMLKDQMTLREEETGVEEKLHNIIEAYNLVELALEKYDKKKFAEVEKLLLKAAELYPNDSINNLLVEMKENKKRGFFSQCNIL